MKRTTSSPRTVWDDPVFKEAGDGRVALFGAGLLEIGWAFSMMQLSSSQ
jgi:hypothetical protein